MNTFSYTAATENICLCFAMKVNPDNIPKHMNLVLQIAVQTLKNLFKY